MAADDMEVSYTNVTQYPSNPTKIMVTSDQNTVAAQDSLYIYIIIR